MKEVRIVLAGKLRSGKSTLAKYAEEKYHMVPFAFGDALKAGFHREYQHIPAHPKPRQGYQLYGQLMRFVHGEDIWVDLCFKQISRIRKYAKDYNVIGSEIAFSPIITDARQPNEFERCIDEDYIVIKIIAPENTRIERAEKDGDNFNLTDLEHETEKHVETLLADYVVYNDGELEDMYQQFDGIMKLIQGGE